MPYKALLIVNEPVTHWGHRLADVSGGSVSITTQWAPNAERGFFHMATADFDVICTVGFPTPPATLCALPAWIRSRWLDLAAMPTDEQVSQHAAANHDRRFERGGRGPVVSVFTPTFNAARWVEGVYNSLAAQTFTEWEWVVVDDESTDATIDVLWRLANADPRVRIYHSTGPMKHRIGALKGAACQYAAGEFLVELDHDDELMPDALREIVGAFRSNPDVGMVYSDFAEVREDGTSNMYGGDAWRYYPAHWHGRDVMVARAPDVYGTFSFGRAIDHMPVCPNHVRAFRRSEYLRVGGYRNLVWADDYDLILRFFARSKILHIPQFLYVQRMHRSTWAANAPQVFRCFEKVRQQYLSEIGE